MLYPIAPMLHPVFQLHSIALATPQYNILNRGVIQRAFIHLVMHDIYLTQNMIKHLHAAR
jgi:hypothetical protein